MNDALFELVTLKSGIKSLRLRDNKEIFHPGIGPLAEARILHVEQQRIRERADAAGNFVIWDVGLGAAANAVAAIEALQGCETDVEIHSFDQTNAPLRFAVEHAEALGYPAPHTEAIHELLRSKHVQLSSRLHWHFHQGDFREQMNRKEIPAPHSIFYDPYSPSSNAEMWTLEHFKNLRKRLDDSHPCLLTNYTRSTAVRVTWLMAGFFVGVGCIIGEKAETTMASNQLESLPLPLNPSWLGRVKTSRNSAPLRQNHYTPGPISSEDLKALLGHQQLH